MTERDQNQGQDRLTVTPPTDRLNNEGDIFMAEGNGDSGPDRGAPIKTAKQPADAPLSTEQIQTARAALGRLKEPGEGASVDEWRVHKLVREALVARADLPSEAPVIRVGPAIWRSKDVDQPITITKYLGKGPDGRDYVATKEFSGGTPLDEIEPTAREQEIIDIVNKAENFYSAFEKIINTSSPEGIKAIIGNNGEVYVTVLTDGLADKNKHWDSNKYLEALRGLNSVSAEEARERLVDILEDIRSERERAGLSDPISATADNAPGPLTEGQKHNQVRLQEEKAAQDRLHRLNMLTVNEAARQSKFHERNAGSETSAGSSPRYSQEELVDSFEAAVERVMNGGRYGGKAMENSEFAQQGINSVQALAEWIELKQSKLLWGKEGGIYPLLDKHNHLNQANFMKWLRSESNRHHDNNPNSDMTPLTNVGIATEYREISVYAISLLEEQYLKDKANGDEVLRDLSNQLINEGFLFGKLRTAELHYGRVMGDPEGIKKILEETHIENVFTRPGNLEFLINMPEEFTDAQEGKDTRVGDTLLNALDIYYNISDAGELEKIFAGHPMTVEDFKKAFMALHDDFDWDMDKDQEFGGLRYKQGSNQVTYTKHKDDGTIGIQNIFKDDGTVDWPVFADVMNFWGEPTSESTKLDFVRELVRIKAAQKSGLKQTGFLRPEEWKDAREKYETDKEYFLDLLLESGREDTDATLKDAEGKAKERFLLRRKAFRVNMKYAEIIAYAMQRPYGNAAKQDLGRTAYDFMTRTSDVTGYFKKQSKIDSGGAVGIREQFGLFNDLSPDMMAGIRTEEGRTFYEIMKELRELEDPTNEDALKKIDLGVKQRVEELLAQGQSQEDIDRDKPEIRRQILEELKKAIKAQLVYKELAEVSYTNNQQKRAIELYNFIGNAKSLDLAKIVSWGAIEGIKYDVGEFQKQVQDELIKHLKYAFINAGINYAENVRIYDPSTKTYWDGNLARKALGTRLYEKVWADFYSNKQVTYDNDGNAIPLRDKYIQQWKDEQSKKDPNLKISEISEAKIIERAFLETFLSSRDVRVRMAKAGSLGVMAAQLKHHNTLSGLGQTWGYSRSETFIDALKTVAELDDDGYEVKDKDGNVKRFYSDEDIAWLRKQGKVEVWRMMTKEIGREGGGALVGGLFESFSKLIGDLAKAA
jgi:hypothetical protein